MRTVTPIGDGSVSGVDSSISRSGSGVLSVSRAAIASTTSASSAFITATAYTCLCRSECVTERAVMSLSITLVTASAAGSGLTHCRSLVDASSINLTRSRPVHAASATLPVPCVSVAGSNLTDAKMPREVLWLSGVLRLCAPPCASTLNSR